MSRVRRNIRGFSEVSLGIMTRHRVLDPMILTHKFDDFKAFFGGACRRTG